MCLGSHSSGLRTSLAEQDDAGRKVHETGSRHDGGGVQADILGLFPGLACMGKVWPPTKYVKAGRPFNLVPSGPGQNNAINYPL